MLEVLLIMMNRHILIYADVEPLKLKDDDDVDDDHDEVYGVNDDDDDDDDDDVTYCQ